MTDPHSGPERPSPSLAVLRVALLASGPAAALLFYAAPAWPAFLERFYGGLWYPVLDRTLARLTGWCPWSLGELLLFALLGWAGAAFARAFASFRRSRREGLRRLARLAQGASMAASVLYATFVLAWALNYQRAPLAQRLGWPAGPAAPGELRELCADLVPRVNALRAAAGPDEDLGRVRDRAPEGYRRLGGVLAPAVPDLEPSRPKFALLSGLMSRALTHGMVVPWSHEALLNRETPRASLPFALCHEMAHQRGIAREDEANFVGYLAARAHPDPAFRYSALRFALAEGLAHLARTDPEASAALVRGLDPAVREDYGKDAAWARARRSRFSEVQGKAYDRYLKAQGQREGVRSYGRVVDLLLAERRLRIAGTLPGALR